MNTSFGLLKVCGTISFVLLCFLRVECNVIGEWEFQNFHPLLDELYWKELDTLTAEDRKSMCLEVYEGQLPPTPALDELSAPDDEDSSNSTWKSANVLTNCPVRFRHALVNMTLIECDDWRLTFYLAQGDEKHVFMLRSEFDGTYSFTGVMRNVTYPVHKIRQSVGRCIINTKTGEKFKLQRDKNEFFSKEEVIFHKVVQHYQKYKAKAPQDISNPLMDDFEVNSRQLLCDAVIKAKQFRIRYYPSEYARRKRPPQDLIPQAFVIGQTTNYQYLMKYFVSEEQLKFRDRLVKQQGLSETMKSMQCADSPTVKWFVTYGFVDKFLYSLEFHRNEVEPALRMTGLIEPSAVINNRERIYFENQFQTSRDSMASICKFAISDILRLCSAIFDVMATEGSLRDEIRRMNYFQAERFWCLKRNVWVNGVLEGTKALRCRIVAEGREKTLFYVLADTRERGAVFVLFETEETNVLELRVRLIKVGALLNPVGSRQVPLHTDTDEESVTDNEEVGSPVDEPELTFEVEDTMDAISDEREETKFKNLADIYHSAPRLSSSSLSTRPFGLRVTTSESPSTSSFTLPHTRRRTE